MSRRAVKPRRVTRGEMRRFVQEVLETFDGQCTYWACEGPDAPTIGMKTCSNCYTLKRARTMLGWLQGDEPKRVTK